MNSAPDSTFGNEDWRKALQRVCFFGWYRNFGFKRIVYRLES